MYKFLVFAAVCAFSCCPSWAAEPIQLDGITEPFRDVTLGLAEPGIIHQQFFQEGDSAKEGETLMELDTRLEELEVARRKAVLEQDKTVMDSTREVFETTKSVSKQDLNKAEAEYAVANA